MNSPSLSNLQGLEHLMEGAMVADTVVLIGSIDPVMGDADKADPALICLAVGPGDPHPNPVIFFYHRISANARFRRNNRLPWNFSSYAIWPK